MKRDIKTSINLCTEKFSGGNKLSKKIVSMINYVIFISYLVFNMLLLMLLIRLNLHMIFSKFCYTFYIVHVSKDVHYEIFIEYCLDIVCMRLESVCICVGLMITQDLIFEIFHYLNHKKYLKVWIELEWNNKWHIKCHDSLLIWHEQTWCKPFCASKRFFVQEGLFAVVIPSVFSKYPHEKCYLTR